jgi:hypothetical protein
MKRNLRTIADVAAAGPFTANQLRWYVFNAPENGLAPAVVRVGRRVYLDVDELDAWIERQNQQRTPAAA